MTPAGRNEVARWAMAVAQALMLLGVGIVAKDLSSIKERVAVIESRVTQLAEFGGAFTRHRLKEGIHQTPEQKRAATYELVDKQIDVAIGRIERKIDALRVRLETDK